MKNQAKTRKSRGSSAKLTSESASVDLSYILESLRSLAVPIDSLKFDDQNVKDHKDNDLSEICDSLTIFGITETALVRESDRRIIHGNGRVMAAQRLGWSHFPVKIEKFEGWTEEKLRALSWALNKTSEGSSWSEEHCRSVLENFDLRDYEHLAEAARNQMFDFDEIRAQNQTLLDSLQQEDQSLAAGKRKRKAKRGFEVVITCRDEAHQDELIKRFRGEGLPCKASG